MKKIMIKFILISLFCVNLHAADFSKINLDTMVANELEHYKVPGCAVGIIYHGEVIFSQGYGLRDREKGLPVTANTIFGIGSCSKAFTSYLLGTLVDEGKISWDDPVIKYIPEWQLMDPQLTREMTIRDLLAHRTGFERNDGIWCNPYFTRDNVIASFQTQRPTSKLREQFHYNNLMYSVAGIITERVTGQKWENVISSKIFNPLGMENSLTVVSKTLEQSDYATPYEGAQPLPFFNVSSVAPAGGICSNVSDMLKWMKVQLHEGSPTISETTLEEMHALQMTAKSSHPSINTSGYGLGWYLGNYRGHSHVFHGGKVDGFISQVSLIPDEKIGVVVLCNNSDGGFDAVPKITKAVLDMLVEERA